ESRSGAVKLADHIADQISGWLKNGENLVSRGRAITPGDIMILVRKRNHLVDALMRALKKRNIPVSGADRMVLNKQIVIQDLLALASFALLPEDDLTLACLLKSPLIGLDEESLCKLAA